MKKKTAKENINRFGAVRVAHQTETAEDYVELIAELIATKGEARAIDISEALGVAHPTVTKTIARLVRDGLAVKMPYRSIFLTEKGRAIAKRSRERHEIVRDFLCSIGVSPETAEIDSEGMEHHVSEETLGIFRKMTGRLKRGG
jgi:DtxR family transcriptional regulator, manganese transport regulator